MLDRFVAKFGRLPTEYDPDYLEMLAMSKYRILAIPDVKPHKCANCGSTKIDDRKYVDFGLEVDWYGAVMLCTHCLKDIANTAGLFTKLEMKILDLELKNKDIQQLQEQGARLHENVAKLGEEFKNYYVSLYSLGDDPSPDNSSNMESDPPAVEQSTDITESATTKSSASSGRKNISKLAELLENKSS